MSSPSRLLARLEALEAALLPKGRLFVFADFGGDPASCEERLASFRAEKGVGPGDELHSVRITFTDPTTQQRLKQPTTNARSKSRGSPGIGVGKIFIGQAASVFMTMAVVLFRAELSV